ncbi:MAG: hypothetical protein WA210_13110 [Burkholderiaceae bacterium]
MQAERSPIEATGNGFAPVRLVLVVFAALLLASFGGNWHARQVSLPRYCEQSELVLQRLAAIVAESWPVSEQARRDYIAAAKLEFLMPPAADEPRDAYLHRVRQQLQRQCR